MSEILATANAGQGKREQSQKRKHDVIDSSDNLTQAKKGAGVNINEVKDKKLKSKLKHIENVYKHSQSEAKKVNEWLLPADSGYLEVEGMERTWQVKQADILGAVGAGATHKALDLHLPGLGPYALRFTDNGRHLVLGGRKGHLAVMDWQRAQLMCEVQVAETTRAVTFLHNYMYFAAAQKKYVYIYDWRGIEVHCLREHGAANALEFLPHHFLLATVGDAGQLAYRDTTHGAIIANHRTRMGPCKVMTQNPHNAVLALGHGNGVVTMWTPNMTTPVVRMLCHKGALTAATIDGGGYTMVTAGLDSQVKVWDVRMFRERHSYFCHAPASHLDISQHGLLALSVGRKVQIWKDALMTRAEHPYMSHSILAAPVSALRFAPYEDVLGIGHGAGIATLLVPGAGEPNFDSRTANPFEARKERREREVVRLLDKLQPDTIVLDPDSIGQVRKEPHAVQMERAALAAEANKQKAREAEVRAEARTKMKGKNRPSRHHRKKQVNIIEERKPGVQQRVQEEAQRKKALADEQQRAETESVPHALARFYKK